MRTAIALSLIGLAVAESMIPSVGLAGVPGPRKCAAAKIKAAGKKAYAKAKCHQTAISKGIVVEPECLTKFCIASPLASSSALCLAEGEMLGPFTGGTLVLGVCPGLGAACVP